MASRCVVEDSDEDDGSIADPEFSSLSEITNELGTVPMMQPSSTDPMLFRAVYEEHLGQLLVDDQLPKRGLSPVFDDPIIDQHISSSASLLSIRKLKRSKTINVSSLSSITEPSLSNQRAIRSESMRDACDLTQITTPWESNDTTRTMVWEVPTSSVSDNQLDVNAKVKSRNAERKNTLKTYGRQIRQMHTVAHTKYRTSTNGILSSPGDDVPQVINQNKLAQNKKYSDLPMPRLMLQKVGSSPSAESHEHGQTNPLDTIPKKEFPESSDTTGTDDRSMPIQVPRSTGVYADIATNQIHTQDRSSPSFAIQINPEATIEDSCLLTKYPAFPGSLKALGSIIIVPDTLSDEQKRQYEILSVASTAVSRRSSPPPIRETIDPRIQYSGDSCTISGDAPFLESPPETIGNGVPAILLSSSPPVLAADRKRKRAKSDVGSKRMAPSIVSSHHNRVVKGKRRSKTMSQGDKSACRESSVDELSLASKESDGNAVCGEVSARSGEAKAHSEDKHELTITDELYSLQKTRPEEERYQPRSSQRRSKSISAKGSKDRSDLSLLRAKVIRNKSLPEAPDAQRYFAHGDVELSTEMPLQACITQDASNIATTLSGKEITEGHFQQAESSVLGSIGDNRNTAVTPAKLPDIKTMPTVPAQPKKRGRKKTSELAATKSNGISNEQSADLSLATSKDVEIQQKALGEMDSTNHEQPLQEMASAPPTKGSMEGVTGIPTPVQTPTKDSKKGSDQHSPLQSGKMPYRVGLSKRTRIAPLLKMIRK